MKRRIDQVLVDRGLATTRQKAQAMILAGQVLVDDLKVEKPGHSVSDDAEIRVLGGHRFASRGGPKLEAALEHFKISVEGKICADLGASTGGFTDCLLQRGAREVHAFDVGRGQLDWRLRTDPRVVVRDGFNVRYIRAGDLPVGISLVTVDLSFISLTRILVPLRDALRARIAGSPVEKAVSTVEVVLLVKPQFEVGRREVGKGGIVRDEAKRVNALRQVEDFARDAGYSLVGSLPSPLPGSEGNREFLLYLLLPIDLSSRP